MWDWRYDEVGSRVLHMGWDGVMDVYMLLLVRGFTWRPNCWTGARIDVLAGTFCLLEELEIAPCPNVRMEPV